MQSKDKPYVLFVAEIIYSKICEIKKKNPSFSNIDSVEGFIGTETYKQISSGKFHEEWLYNLEKNNLIDSNTKRKVPEEEKVYAGPNIAVGDAQAPKKLIANNPKIIFLLIIITTNLIHFLIQLKVELKTLIFISNLTKFKDSK